MTLTNNIPGGYYKTTERTITRRGVLWLGQTCNLRCFFCYFQDRVADAKHPHHQFMTLEKAKTICKTLVDVYGNNAIDIQGGEPVIYKEINELVKYCVEIGLTPTLITNAIALDDYEKCIKLKEAGVKDLLFSVQGLGDIYDLNVCVKGASKRQEKALENIIKAEIPFRFNTVLNKNVLPQLKDIARLAVEKRARAVNLLAFNPFADQQLEGHRNETIVPRYSEAVPYITEAIDILENAGIEANVRFYPLCMFEEKYRKSVYNYQQLIYDPHEWDWASFAWTYRDEQRMREGDVGELVSIEQHNIEMANIPDEHPNLLKRLFEEHANRFPKLTYGIKELTRRFTSLFASQNNSKNIFNLPKEEAYRLNGRWRAEKHCNYKKVKACEMCALKDICDGFHGDYVGFFGDSEAKPVTGIPVISDPKHYIKNQEKVVEV